MPYVGLHIHKTAGTSLLRYLEKYAPLRLYGAYSVRNFRHLELPLWATHNVSAKDIFWGHAIYESFFYNVADHVRLFTFLRDPNERILSWYMMLKRRGKLKSSSYSLESFASAHSNSMSKMLVDRFPSLVNDNSAEIHRQALDVLESMSFVGLQSRYSEHLPLLLDWMGVNWDPRLQDSRHNTAPKKAIISDATKDILDMYNDQDNKLFSLAFERYADSPMNPAASVTLLEDSNAITTREEIKRRQVTAAQKKFLSSLRYSIGEVGLDQYIQSIDIAYKQCAARLKNV